MLPGFGAWSLRTPGSFSFHTLPPSSWSLALHIAKTSTCSKSRARADLSEHSTAFGRQRIVDLALVGPQHFVHRGSTRDIGLSLERWLIRYSNLYLRWRSLQRSVLQVHPHHLNDLVLNLRHAASTSSSTVRCPTRCWNTAITRACSLPVELTCSATMWESHGTTCVKSHLHWPWATPNASLSRDQTGNQNQQQTNLWDTCSGLMKKDTTLRVTGDVCCNRAKNGASCVSSRFFMCSSYSYISVLYPLIMCGSNAFWQSFANNSATHQRFLASTLPFDLIFPIRSPLAAAWSPLLLTPPACFASAANCTLLARKIIAQ